MQESGCGALWSLAAKMDDSKVTIAKAGGIQAVLAAMEQHKSHAGVQGHCFVSGGRKQTSGSRFGRRETRRQCKPPWVV